MKIKRNKWMSADELITIIDSCMKNDYETALIIIRENLDNTDSKRTTDLWMMIYGFVVAFMEDYTKAIDIFNTLVDTIEPERAKLLCQEGIHICNKMRFE